MGVTTRPNRWFPPSPPKKFFIADSDSGPQKTLFKIEFGQKIFANFFSRPKNLEKSFPEHKKFWKFFLPKSGQMNSPI